MREHLLRPHTVPAPLHAIGPNQEEVECLAIRWLGAGGDREKLVLPAVCTLVFPLAVVGSMRVRSFLLAMVVYPAGKRPERHCQQKRHEVLKVTTGCA